MSFRFLCSLLCLAFSFSAHSASVHLSPCDEKLSQKWTLRNRALMNADNCVVETEETGEFELGACETSSSLEFDKQIGRIVQRTSGLCLDCSSYAKSRSWNVEIKECSGSDSQKWVYDEGKKTVLCKEAALYRKMCLDVGATPTCADTPYSAFPYCNVSLDLITRTKDLVSRMTVAQKISQLVTGAPGVSSDNVSIAGYQWWSEALHGVAGSPGVHFGGKLPHATSYPQVNTLGATFNKSLWLEMGNFIGIEARAFANQGQAGLTYFAPNINIYRDPRWGRGQETPGEDPYLSANYAEAFVRGMQTGTDPGHYKVITTCKHYDAYDLENWNGTDRHHFDAKVADIDLIETYLPAFEACVRYSHTGSIMCSYNAVNGVPSCANDFLQNEIVRRQWGFEGYIVSDCGAISNIMSTHGYTKTPEDTVAAGLKGGCDLDCGSFYSKNGQTAFDKKTITEDDLDLAMWRLFSHRIRLGEFDPIEEQPYREITPDVVCSQPHLDLALNAAREGVVLLENKNGALPLSTSAKVALIGPNADATSTMQGNYHGTAPFLISPLMGIQKLGVNVTYVQGCDVKCSSTSGFADAVNLAKSSDVTVLVMGLDNGQASEGHDRNDITFPGNQEMLIQQVKNASKGHVIMVLMTGGPVDISWAKDNLDGILWVGYPGQAGGQAIAEVLFGQYNPGGRLPYTIYPGDYVNQISFFDMSMRQSPGRTYKFYTGTPVYSFGDGLSYTTFQYQWMSSNYSERAVSFFGTKSVIGAMPSFRVKVENTGHMAGDTVVLAYVNSTAPGAPLKELIGFERIHLDAGKSEEVFFGFPPEVFSVVVESGCRIVHPGKYGITIGDLHHVVHLHGDPVLLKENPLKPEVC
ncbi:uncharacterized protein [Oscarella lobularis]|uniref:uncharacterized protein n=1 Tax=Oscarella lobularis TaxID=121494 RepID=UPI003313B2EC